MLGLTFTWIDDPDGDSVCEAGGYVLEVERVTAATWYACVRRAGEFDPDKMVWAACDGCGVWPVTAAGAKWLCEVVVRSELSKGVHGHG